MDVQIDWVGIAVATVAAMVIGSIWYSKWLMGPQWQKLAGLKDDKSMSATPAMVQTVLLTLLVAYILNHLIYMAHAFYDYSWVETGLSTAFWVWLGVAFPFQWMNGLFEGKRKKLVMINLTNQLITLLAMGAIIGAFLNP